MGLFGSGQQGKIAPAYTGLQLQTSSGIVCIPLCWGQARGAPNLIWYGDFSSKAQNSGGKGGGGVTSYDYHASLLEALCQGPIHSIGNCWINSGSEVPLSQTHFSLIAHGNTPQHPWSYLTANHPDQALSYNGVALVGTINYDLGSSPYTPTTAFEVYGLRWNTGPGSTGDADVALIIQDFLSNHDWSVGIPAGLLGNLISTGSNDGSFQNYCQAMGFGLSPYIQNQEGALGILKRWTDFTNTAVFWSGYSLKFVPYGDSVVTGYGYTFTPDLTPAYTITDQDLILQDDGDPVVLSRKDPADCYNLVKLTINNRASFYNSTPVVQDSLALIQEFGERADDVSSASEVCVLTMAATMAQLRLSRVAYIRNTFSLQLPSRFALLEPMDILEIPEPMLGTFLLRITSIEEQDEGSFKIEGEQLNVGLSSPGATTDPQGITNNPQNQLVIPAPVNSPIIFEPPSSMTQGFAQIWIAASGGNSGVFDPNWGGYNLYLSTDGTTYEYEVTFQRVSRQGLLSATLAAYGGSNPDSSHTLSVNMAESEGELIGTTTLSAANQQTICYVDGEFISFEVATLTGTNAYNLTNLWRGLNGTTAGAHSSGTKFARLDDSVCKLTLPAMYVGVPLYVKLQSINIYGQQPQDLSTCTAYSYTPSGTGFGGGSGGVPKQPTGLAIVPGIQSATLSWSANVSTDNIISYLVYRAPGSGSSFGSSSQVASINGLTWTDSGLSASTAYTYFIVAENVIGSSSPSTGVNVTTSSIAILQQIYIPSVFSPGLMDSSQLMVVHTFAETAQIPLNLSGTQFGATAGSAATVILNIDQALIAAPNTWTTIGTITITGLSYALATVGGVAYNLSIGDRVRIVGPSTPDATLANPNVTLLTKRT